MASQLHRISALSEVRKANTPVKKAVAASTSPGVGIRAAAKHFGVSRSSARRAKVALENGRQFGVAGAPGLFTKEKEQEIVEYCKQEDRRGHALTKEALVDHVHVLMMCFSLV